MIEQIPKCQYCGAIENPTRSHFPDREFIVNDGTLIPQINWECNVCRVDSNRKIGLCMRDLRTSGNTISQVVIGSSTLTITAGSFVTGFETINIAGDPKAVHLYPRESQAVVTNIVVSGGSAAITISGAQPVIFYAIFHN